MSTIRRRYLTDPGEPLLIASSVIDIASRYTEFSSSSNLVSDRILSTSAVSVPFPRRLADQADRRWPGLHPAMAWHPLLWLPDRLSGRYLLTQPDGSEVYETDAVWAIRVALEVSAARIYDVETGSWFDPLAAYGVDVSRVEDRHRVRAWLEGGHDPVLDSIDLSNSLVSGDDEAWALEAALAIEPVVVEATWHILATDLLEMAQSAATVGEQMVDQIREIISEMGPELFEGVPSDLDAIYAPDASIDEIISTLRDLAATYEPSLRELSALDGLAPTV